MSRVSRVSRFLSWMRQQNILLLAARYPHILRGGATALTSVVWSGWFGGRCTEWGGSLGNGVYFSRHTCKVCRVTSLTLRISLVKRLLFSFIF